MLKYLFFNRYSLIALFTINLLGTIYGYYWYKSQIAETPAIFIPFVPDSPTASLFFTLFLLFYLNGKTVRTIEALAFVSLLKYGIWAVVMNLFTLVVDGQLPWTGYMLMVSHGAMALQAYIYSPLYTFSLRHLTIASIFLLHNEIIDYVYGMMPTYGSLSEYADHIGYFTFWLSIACILFAYFKTIYPKEKKVHSKSL